MYGIFLFNANYFISSVTLDLTIVMEVELRRRQLINQSSSNSQRKQQFIIDLPTLYIISREEENEIR